jgi:hypothetical protein
VIAHKSLCFSQQLKLGLRSILSAETYALPGVILYHLFYFSLFYFRIGNIVLVFNLKGLLFTASQLCILMGVLCITDCVFQL